MHFLFFVSERTFSFSEDQVRVVLFRECDFRGRKLLFDSQSVQKVPLPSTVSKTPPNILCSSPQHSKNEVFVEMSNGYGYQVSDYFNVCVFCCLLVIFFSIQDLLETSYS